MKDKAYLVTTNPTYPSKNFHICVPHPLFLHHQQQS
ncbi:hypothetical protein LOK49_LG04G03255 [Camellia lanceoleosa]|uniref:Uncharacterized protein n=1 Tax=Camellia lanceoleosa TaxID=1840588 RepID=A0ACC0I173_9ERIC|nr:hypothetical protein LOK49_LG04G03255 [Camellia lanceoleosa]